MTLRVGTGYDVHRLVPGRELKLCGITVPHAKGLLGHSDGDSALHAVCDALLGAVAAGDMGAHFPSRDPRWSGVDSRVFVAEVVRLVGERGGRVENVDLTIIAGEPVLAPHLPAMRGSLAAALGIDLGAVSVKAKSTDGLGDIGRGLGIAAQAAVLVRLESAPLESRPGGLPE